MWHNVLSRSVRKSSQRLQHAIGVLLRWALWLSGYQHSKQAAAAVQQSSGEKSQAGRLSNRRSLDNQHSQAQEYHRPHQRRVYQAPQVKRLPGLSQRVMLHRRDYQIKRRVERQVSQVLEQVKQQAQEAREAGPLPSWGRYPQEDWRAQATMPAAQAADQSKDNHAAGYGCKAAR